MADDGNDHPPPALPLQSIRVTLVRHGQSVDNLNGIWAGHKDSPLTSTGLAQAQALAQAFANVRLDAIYSSDLKRASQTAHEIVNANQTHPPPPLVQTQSLREQFFGSAEGQSARQVESAYASTPRNAAFPSGETLEAVNKRLAIAVRRFILPRLEGLRGRATVGVDGSDNAATPHVCIVAHGIAIAELLRVFMSSHDAASEYGEPWPHPASTYQRTRLENTGWTTLQLSVPAAGAKPSVELDSSSLATHERPTTRDVFVRFIGHQNNVDHLQDLNTNTTAASAAVRRSRQSSMIAASQRDQPQQQQQNPLDAYSAGFMTKAIGGNGNGHANINVPVDDDNGPLSAALGRHYAGPGVGGGPRDRDLLGFLSAYQILGSSSTNGGGAAAAPPTSSRANPLLPLPSSLPLPPPPPPQLSGSNTELWKSITARILPIFKGEGLRGSMEDVNDLVSQHIRHTLDRGPARAWSSLSNDLRTLLQTGMLTLDSRIVGSATTSDDATLLVKLATCWSTFANVVLPWVEAAFLPLGTDPVLLSLASAIGSSSSGGGGGGGVASAAGSNAGATATAAASAAQSGLPSPALRNPQPPSLSSTSTSTSHLQLPPAAMSAANDNRNAGAATGAAAAASPHVPPSPAGTAGAFSSPHTTNTASSTTTTTPNLNGSGSTSGAPASAPTPSLLRSQRIDVRKVSLTIFRDSVLLPNFERLFLLFARIASVPIGAAGAGAGTAPPPQPSSSTTPTLGLGLGLGLSVGGAAPTTTTSSTSTSSRAAPASNRSNTTTAAASAGADDDNPSSTTPSSIAHRLTQMTHRVRCVQSGDEAQQATDALLRALRVGVAAMTDGGGEGAHARGGNHPASAFHAYASPHRPPPRAAPPHTTAIPASATFHGAPSTRVQPPSLSSAGAATSSTLPPTMSLQSIHDLTSSLTLDSHLPNARAVNRRGWMPRAAAKHGVHAPVGVGVGGNDKDVDEQREEGGVDGDGDDDVDDPTSSPSLRPPSAAHPRALSTSPSTSTSPRASSLIATADSAHLAPGNTNAMLTTDDNADAEARTSRPKSGTSFLPSFEASFDNGDGSGGGDVEDDDDSGVVAA